jgi:hypothetical protein
MARFGISLAQANSLPAFEHETLAPGKASGTFAFTYTGRVRFSQESAFPVTVEIADYAHKLVYRMTVSDSAPFTLSTDLSPGSYWIESEVAPEKDKIYWKAIGQQFFIDAKGDVNLSMHPDNHDLVHVKKLTVISPDPSGGTTVLDPRPLLKWQALPGAVRYQVNWLIEDAPFHVVGHGSGGTDATEFRLNEDTIPNRQYEWSVWAFGPGVEGQLGYWSAAYFFSPGGKEAFLKGPKGPVSAMKGMPYIGIVPLRLLGSGSLSKPEGITVHGVEGNSPAMKAGLQPNDVLTSFNGKSLADASEADFVEMVRALPIGARVPVEYLRDGKTQTAEISIEAAP